MKYFVTGASGWMGTAIIRELLVNGHEAVGLARSNETAEYVESLGAQVVRGDLTDPASLATAAAQSDGVAHMAFQHDVAFGMGDFLTAATTDRRAIEATGEALAGTGKPFVLASGLLGLSPGRTAVETDGLIAPTGPIANGPGIRAANALLALSLRGIGVRSSILRLPPTVHGTGDKGFMKTFINVAREKGVAGYVGNGDQRWPAVHISDAASLACAALHNAPAGSVLHVVGEGGVTFKDIAETMAKKLDIGTTSVEAANAFTHFGPLGPLACIDSPANGDATRELLQWKPTGPTLLEDLAQDHYYA